MYGYSFKYLLNYSKVHLYLKLSDNTAFRMRCDTIQLSAHSVPVLGEPDLAEVDIVAWLCC